MVDPYFLSSFILQEDHSLLTHPLLPPATKLWQGNVFTPVSHSVHRGGCLPLVQGGVCHTTLGRHSPWADTPHRQTTPSACWDTHTPCPVHAGIRSSSGRYASHWNAFLLFFKVCLWEKLWLKPFSHRQPLKKTIAGPVRSGRSSYRLWFT